MLPIASQPDPTHPSQPTVVPTVGRSLWRWFDASTTRPVQAPGGRVTGPESAARAAQQVDWLRVLPFVGLHLMCLVVLWVGWHPGAVAVAAGLYVVRMFAITGFYHRDFSHRAFKTSRAAQFALALLGASATQRGLCPLLAVHKAGNHPGISSRRALHMRIAGVVVLPVLLMGCASSAHEPKSVGLLPLVGEDSVTTVSLMLGERWLDDDDDNTVDALELDEQSVFGVEIDSYNRDSGNGFEVGLATSWEDNTIAGVNAEVDMNEVYAGFRKTFMLDDQFHPFISGGVSYIDGELDVGPSSDDGTSLATYLRAGILWDLGDRLRLGLDYRYLWGGDIFGGLADADYDQVALSLGYRF